MALTEINYAPGQDTLEEVFDKINAAIAEINDNQIKWKVVSIGAWNMDTTASINVPHGLAGAGWAKIKIVSAMIYPDSSDALVPLSFDNATGTTIEGGVQYIDDTNILLTRFSGGTFDGSSYNIGSPFNRGFVTIGYTE